MLINLAVEQTDVSMVFEVINDRGVRLRPYEILKGKLLGQINKFELDNDDYNALWEGQAAAINAFKEDELDSFFRFYLKAKFSATRKEGHDLMVTTTGRCLPELDGHAWSPTQSGQSEDIPEGRLHLLHQTLHQAAEGLCQGPKPFRAVYYNALLDLDAPFLLTLSACVPNDPDEVEKIQIIANEVDRYFSLLQLQSAYDSNEFADSLFDISEAIRGQATDTFRMAFDAN